MMHAEHHLDAGRPGKDRRCELRLAPGASSQLLASYPLLPCCIARQHPLSSGWAAPVGLLRV